jgi:hypothetical protein
VTKKSVKEMIRDEEREREREREHACVCELPFSNAVNG